MAAVALAAIAVPAVARGTTYVPSAEPTAYEQLMLELINRARANPGAEAARLGIDLNEGLAAGTISNTPKQPLATHGKLLQAARAHSQWMLDADVFSHTGAGGATATQRVQSAGYPLGGGHAVGENIGWGGATGPVDLSLHTVERHDALFLSSKHRVNLCFGSFDEVGVGLLAGVFTASGTAWNASMVTHNFAYSGATPGPLVTGVAYHDFNGNGFYDVGEGIRGVTVNVSGSSYHTLTTGAGGYALPIPASSGPRTVTFSGTGFSVDQSLSIAVAVNHKIDFTPVYQPPALAGSSTPVAGLCNRYTLSPDPLATARQVQVERWMPVADDTASSLDRVTVGGSSAYPVLSTTVLRSAPAAYHLAHIEPVDQFLAYKSEFEVGANAELALSSRLGAATSDQTAVVQVSADGGLCWTTVYSQAGSSGWGEPVFNRRVVSLAAFAGKRVKLRFGYLVAGWWFGGAADGYGWYVDDVTFTRIQEVVPVAVHTLAADADFYFRPPAPGPYQIIAKTVHFNQVWPQGPALAVTAGPETPTLATWAAKQEDANGLPPGALLGNLGGDYKGNGVPLALARALGLDPLTTTTAALPKMLPNGDFLDFDYWRDLSATEVTLTPEISVDGGAFFALGNTGVPVPYSDTVLSSGSGTLEYRRLRIAKSAAPKVFVRLKASAN